MDGPDVFDVLSDATRRRILELLRERERPVGELAEALGAPQPNVSKHLKVLGRTGLVRARAEGPRRHYGLVPGGLAEVEEWLQPFREIWADRLDALERHLDATGPATTTDDTEE